MVLFHDDPKWQRLIYPSHEGYREVEIEKYEELEEYFEEHNIIIPKWVTKRMKMRNMQGNDFKVPVWAQKLVEHLEWRKEHLPIILNDTQKHILDSGLFYVHGRDRSLRPVTFFCPKIILEIEWELEESLLACHFVADYIIENMFVVGKIENWINVLDLAKLGFTSLPKKWIIHFIKHFSTHMFARTRWMFILNAGVAVSMMWSIVKIFVHHTTKSKLIFNKQSTDPKLQEMVHPSQLQQQYGGEAEDVTVFWPPYKASDEYGVDIYKLKDKDPFEASLVQDVPLVMPSTVYETNITAGVTHKIDHVKLEDIIVEPEVDPQQRVKKIGKNEVGKVKKGKGGWCTIF